MLFLRIRFMIAYRDNVGLTKHNCPRTLIIRRLGYSIGITLHQKSSTLVRCIYGVLARGSYSLDL